MKKNNVFVSAGQVFPLPTDKQSSKSRHVRMIKVFIARNLIRAAD